MTLRLLHIFTAVVDAGGMNRAAQQLHISQPSISQAISELEEHYGVKLFERLSRKLYLTKEGELLLSFSRHILDSYQQMEESMNESASKTHLSIGCSVSVGTCLIGDLLEQAEQLLPNCAFQIKVANSSEIEQDLLNNRLDVGIIEGFIADENLTALPMCKDELVIVCGKKHPLAAQKNIALQALQNCDYVSRETGSAERNQYEQLLEQNGIHLNRSFCSTNTEAIKNAVKRGRGIAIFSSRMVAGEVAEGSLHILPIAHTRVIRDFHLVIHKNKYLSPSLKAFRDLCLHREG